MTPTRRRFLAAGGATAAGLSLAGCLGGGNTGGSATGGDSAGGTTQPTSITLETLGIGDRPAETVPAVASGQVTVLDFFATWCKPCERQLPRLATVHEQFPDVHMLSITWESDEAAVRSWWTERPGTWPVVADKSGETGQQFGVTALPTLLVFDAEGAEQWRHAGLATVDRLASKLEAAGATPAE